MANGIYTAVSGAITQIHRMDVMANNLANVRTPGFKAEDVALHDVEASGDGRDGTRGQDARTYSQVADTFVRHDSGELYETSNPLDLAIRGDGFLRIQTPRGERLTRNGRLVLGRDGGLRTQLGDSVLDDAGRPIYLPSDRVPVIEEDGLIRGSNDLPDLRIGLRAFADVSALEKDEEGLFMQTGPRSESSTGVASETIVVLQGYLEDANVNPVQMMTQIIEAQRHYQALHQVIESSADMDQTVSRLAGS